MGMKKAKLLKKLEDAGVLSSTTTGMFLDPVSGSRNNEEESVIADMSSATKELVSVLKAATSLKQDEARMRKHDKWMKMITDTFHDHFTSSQQLCNDQTSWIMHSAQHPASLISLQKPTPHPGLPMVEGGSNKVSN